MNIIPEKDKSGGKKYIARLEGTIEDIITHILSKIECVLGADFVKNHSPKLLFYHQLMEHDTN